MGFTNVPPSMSDGSSQLMGQKQSRYCHQGIRRGRVMMLPGLRPAICGEDRLPRRKKGKRPPRGAPGWAGISPSASQWEGVPKQPLQRGKVRSRAQSLPGSGLAKLLLSISGFRNGWCGLRYSVPTRTSWAYSWTTREMIELD